MTVAQQEYRQEVKTIMIDCYSAINNNKGLPSTTEWLQPNITLSGTIQTQSEKHQIFLLVEVSMYIYK